MKYLTRQEELVLLTVYHLKENSYLVKIREHLNMHSRRKWSISSVFVPLDRLTKNGFLSTKIGQPTAKRGGKAIKYYILTDEGKNALAEVKMIHETMWNGVTGPVFES